MASVEMAPKRRPDPASHNPVDQAEIDALMRRFFEQTRQDVAVPATTLLADGDDAPPARPRRDFDMACELLERASQAFDLLAARCERLDGELVQSTEQLRAQDEAIEQWKRLASGLKTQLQASDQAAAASKARSEAAEARAEQAEARVAMLERASAQAADQAATAEKLSTKLHDKVVTAFGIGSRAHSMLEAVATQARD